MIRKSHWLQDHMEPAIANSKELNQAPKNPAAMLVSDNNDIITATAGNDRLSLLQS